MTRYTVAALLLVGTVLGTGVAHAQDPELEPDTTTLICQQLALGQEPGDIADDLHEGDPRYSVADTTQTVLEASWECP